MNGLERDDIIRMAQEAGWGFNNSRDSDFVKAQLKFAELVAAATLKNSVMTDEEYEQAMADEGQRRMLEIDTEVRAMIKEAVAAEREACAKVCEQRAADHEEDSRFEDDPDYKERYLVYAKHERRCAKEIRARGNDAA